MPPFSGSNGVRFPRATLSTQPWRELGLRLLHAAITVRPCHVVWVGERERTGRRKPEALSTDADARWRTGS